MAVKIRLARRGRKKLALFDVVVADSRSPRDGRFIEKIGIYNPNTNPATIQLDDTRALKWVMDGAQPTDTVRAMLSYRGVMMKKHLQVGVNKGAISQEVADKRYADWLASKESKISGKVDMLTAKKDAASKARLEAERKVQEARAEVLKAKLAAVAASEVVAEAQEEAEATQQEVATDAPVVDAAPDAPAAEETAAE